MKPIKAKPNYRGRYFGYWDGRQVKPMNITEEGTWLHCNHEGKWFAVYPTTNKCWTEIFDHGVKNYLAVISIGVLRVADLETRRKYCLPEFHRFL